MKDPQRSEQEFRSFSKNFPVIFKGSSKFLSRSSRILRGKWKILNDLDKNFEDPCRSWQENEGSLKIFKDFSKILMKFLKRIL